MAIMKFAGVSSLLLLMVVASCCAQYGDYDMSYVYNNIPYSAFNWSPDNPGYSYDNGYGADSQQWFKGWNRALDNYGFSSSLPYGYGSGALPMFGSEPYAAPWTSYGYGGYVKSSLPYVDYYPGGY